MSINNSENVGTYLSSSSSIYLSDAQKNRVRLGTEILRTRHRTTNYHSITQNNFHDLNLMQAATGSQWISMSSGVTCALFGWFNTRCAVACWIICSGFIT